MSPSAMRWVRCGAAVAGTCLLAIGLLCSFLVARESAWPWVERAPAFGWLHYVNDSGWAVAWGLHFDGAEKWWWYQPDRFDGEPEPTKWRPEHDVLQIVPGCDSWAGEVREVRVEFPDPSGLPVASWSFALEPGMHRRIRVDRSGQLFVASGEVTWVGSVSFGPEQRIPGP